MLQPDFRLLDEGDTNTLIVVATAADGFSHPPPYAEDEQGNKQQPGAWGHRLQSQGGYSLVSTRGSEIWVHSNALLDIDAAILQGYKDNPELSRVKDLKYGLYKGLRIGMILMAFLSGVITLVAVGQSTVSAFEESPLKGVLCLTIIYAPYYAFMRWYKLKSTFKMFVFGLTLTIFSVVVYFSIPTLLPLVRGMGQI
jgi:hypothetical protein